MKHVKDFIVVGIDHGYGNIKTAGTVTKAGIKEYPTKPVLTSNVLEMNDRFYVLGEDHKSFKSDKTEDTDYLIMTYGAVAKELSQENITKADVYISAGLPLTWVGTQRKEFEEYLLSNRKAEFVFRDVPYELSFVGCDIFPQCYPAVLSHISQMRGVNMIADIGNGTMNVMFIENHKPVQSKTYTEKLGVNQCCIAMKNAVSNAYAVQISDATLEQFIRTGSADITEKYLKHLNDTAKEYCKQIMDCLQKYEYNPDLMKLYVTGGGGVILRNFGNYESSRVIIIDDICAAAKGFENLSCQKLRKNGIV